MPSSTADRDRVADEVAHRHGLGTRLSSSSLKAGTDFVGGLFALAVGSGGVVLLVHLGVPTTGGGVAGTLALAVGALFFVTGGVGLLRSGAATRGRRLHAYANGLVAESPAGPVPVHYSELLVYRQQTDHVRGSVIMGTTVNWRLARRDGAPWALDVLTEPTDGLQTFLDAALANTCSAQADEQAAALAAGSSLTFGDISFDGYRLRFPGHEVAWTDVKAVNLATGSVMVTLAHDGRLVKELPRAIGTVGTIPNFVLFWTLFQQASHNSRGASAPSTGTASIGSPATGTGQAHRPRVPGASPPTSGTSGPDAAGSRST